MNDAQKLVRRLEAARAGRAVLVRASRELSPDPQVTVGIAPIKIVTEEHVQALAFGPIGSAPTLIARVDPLGRDASDLEPFAKWLNARMVSAQASGSMPRVWLPHRNALETLDVLGHRYERNRSASPDLQQMGKICRLIARESRHEGQQAVAIASEVLLSHVATGQSPAEDAHLGALLAWINPPQGRTAAEAAQERALDPAAGILANRPGRRDDERVEVLRREWKRAHGDRREHLENTIRRILDAAATDEWALLQEAHAAFWALPLRPGQLQECDEGSKERMTWGIANGPTQPRNPVPRIREMTALEHSQSSAQRARLLGDPVLRAEARTRGRAILGAVARVEQPRYNFNPCWMTLLVPQRELRFRRDDAVVLVGSTVTARVDSVTYDPTTGGSLVRLEITKGVRSIQGAALGKELEWIPHSAFPYQLKLKQLRTTSTPWMLDPEAPMPAAKSKRRLAGDLLALAAKQFGSHS